MYEIFSPLLRFFMLGSSVVPKFTSSISSSVGSSFSGSFSFVFSFTSPHERSSPFDEATWHRWILLLPSHLLLVICKGALLFRSRLSFSFSVAPIVTSTRSILVIGVVSWYRFSKNMEGIISGRVWIDPSFFLSLGHGEPPAGGSLPYTMQHSSNIPPIPEKAIFSANCLFTVKLSPTYLKD